MKTKYYARHIVSDAVMMSILTNLLILMVVLCINSTISVIVSVVSIVILLGFIKNQYDELKKDIEKLERIKA